MCGTFGRVDALDEPSATIGGGGVCRPPGQLGWTHWIHHHGITIDAAEVPGQPSARGCCTCGFKPQVVLFGFAVQETAKQSPATARPAADISAQMQLLLLLICVLKQAWAPS